MKYFMKKIEKMLKSENDDVALQNRILDVLSRVNPSFQKIKEENLTVDQFIAENQYPSAIKAPEPLEEMKQALIMDESRKKLSEIAGIYLSGEEFLIFLPKTDKDNAGKIAEEVRAAIEASRIKDAGREITNTVSMGCASLRQVSADAVGDVLDLMIKLADEALYSSKREGRNRVTIYVRI